MRLDVEKARQAGREVQEVGAKLAESQVAKALREAAAGLDGLGSAPDSLRAAADGHESFTRRFRDEHDWLGDAVIGAADKIDATDEDAKASIEKAGIPL